MKYTDSAHLESITDSVLETLPHGSGINGKWICEIKESQVVFSNSYDAMSEGMYCHVINFSIVIDLKDSSILFDSWRIESNASTQDEIITDEGTEEESTCGCLCEVDQYLDDSFVEYFDDIKKYVLVVDHDERGEFKAHVENKTIESIVFEYGTDEDGNLDLTQDGFMSHPTDSNKLEKYLHSLGILDSESYIDSVRK